MIRDSQTESAVVRDEQKITGNVQLAEGVCGALPSSCHFIEPEAVIPALTNLLEDVSPAARAIALNGLGEFGPSARPAAGTVLEILKLDQNLRETAKQALKRIAPDMLTNAPDQ